jgi:hypothetical protein
VLPVLHEADDPVLSENEPPPVIFEAKVEIFFLTCRLPQVGQVTSSMALELRTSSSNGWLQVAQTNSNKGIVHSFRSGLPDGRR